MIVTKDLALAEMITVLGGSLLSIKRADHPLDPQTYTFKEDISKFLKALDEKYGLGKDAVVKLLENYIAEKPVIEKKRK